MNRLIPILAVAALVGGVAGGAIDAYALNNDNDSTPAAPPAPVATSVSSGGGEAPTAEQIYRDDAPGVVVITDTQTHSPRRPSSGPSSSACVLGSGFVLDPKGDIVTNDHVVQGATAVRVGFSGGATYPAKVVGADPSTISPWSGSTRRATSAPPLALRRRRRRAGRRHRLRDRQPLRARPDDDGRHRQRSRARDPGPERSRDRERDPDRRGRQPRQLGRPADRPDRARDRRELPDRDRWDIQGNVGVGFAVPSATVRTVAAQLLATGHAEHPYIGVEVETIDPVVADVAKGVPEHGVLVSHVAQGGPAAKAGIVGGTEQLVVQGEQVVVGGDAIVAIDGKAVDTSDQLAALVAQHRPGDRVVLRVVRDGTARSVTVTVGTAPANG